MPRLLDGGFGVYRAGLVENGVKQPSGLPKLKGTDGVHRQMPHIGNSGRGVHRTHISLVEVHRNSVKDLLLDYFYALADRLRRVRVCCGDWTRIMGKSVTYLIGLTGVFLDPPYDQELRDSELYSEDEIGLSSAVMKWAIDNGDNPLLRIALCGYEGEHEMPSSWSKYNWTASGGYGLQGNDRGRENRDKEVIWFSPHCLNELPLFR